MNKRYLRSNLARGAVLSRQARVKSITSFLENCLRDRELLLPKEVRFAVTFLTSLVCEYRYIKLGCLLFSIGSSNSGTTLHGGGGAGKALFYPLEVSKASESPFRAKCLN